MKAAPSYSPEKTSTSTAYRVYPPRFAIGKDRKAAHNPLRLLAILHTQVRHSRGSHAASNPRIRSTLSDHSTVVSDSPQTPESFEHGEIFFLREVQRV